MASLTDLGLRFVNAPGLLTKIAEDYHLTQTVIVPAGKSIVYCSGHVGLDESGNPAKDVETEIYNLFKNIEKSLAAAGVKNGFKSVFHMTSYHTILDEEHEIALAKVHGEFTGPNKPAWTGVVVNSLSEGVSMEIQVQAILE